MTIRELLIQIGFAISKGSADKVEKKIDDIKKKLDDTGESGEKAGKEAAGGIEKIIPAAEKAGSEIKDIAAAAILAGDGVDSAMDKAADKLKDVGAEAAKTKEKVQGIGDIPALPKENNSPSNPSENTDGNSDDGAGDSLADPGGSLADAGDALADAGEKMVVVGGVMAAPIVAGVVAAAKFEESMSNVKAITGATGDSFEQLEKKAIDLGGSTKYSAEEVSGAMLELGRAGWDAEQIFGGIDGVLAAAAAGNVDLAQTSEIVSATINSMGLAIGQSSHVADVLAMTANKTATGIKEMGETFKYCAPLAKQLDFSLENMGAASGLMANAGIKGSEAGTALRAGLTRLADPTKDATVLLSSFGIALSDFSGPNKMADFIGALKGAMAGLSNEERVAAASTIFGQEAMSGWLAVIDQGPEKVAELTNALQNSDGEAARQAKIMQDNLKGAIEQVGGAINSLGIAIGTPFLVPLTELGLGLADFIGKITAWVQENSGLVKTISMVIAVISSLLTVVGSIAIAIGSIIGIVAAMQAAWAAIPAVGAALGAAIGPALAVVAAVAAIGYALYDLYQWVNGGESCIGELIGPWDKFKAAALDALAPVISFVEALWNEIQWGWNMVSPYLEKFIAWISGFSDEIIGFLEVFAGAVLLFMVAPLLLVIAQIAAVIAAIMSIIGAIVYVYEHGGEMLEAFGAAILGFFTAAFNGIAQGATGLLMKIGQFFGGLIQGAVNAVAALVNGFSYGISRIKEFFSGLLEFVKDILSQIGGFIMDKISWAKGALSNLMSFSDNATRGVVENSTRSYSDSRSYSFSLRDVSEVKPALAATGGEFDLEYMRPNG